jgi:hypothetical protein
MRTKTRQCTLAICGEQSHSPDPPRAKGVSGVNEDGHADASSIQDELPIIGLRQTATG